MPLTEQALTQALKELPLWDLRDGKLVRDWTFPSFAEAMTFVNRIAGLAEAQDHHPDIDIRYNKVRLALISHDANGITSRDVRFAARVNADLPAFKEK